MHALQQTKLKMMSETEEKYEASASANPFDESDEAVEDSVEVEQPETMASPASTKNPFESDEVEDDTSCNPFEDDVTTEGNTEDYKCVSLDAPAVGLSKTQNGEWDLEWEHVSAAVKKNFSSISVVAPELISSMMSK